MRERRKLSQQRERCNRNPNLNLQLGRQLNLRRKGDSQVLGVTIAWVGFPVEILGFMNNSHFTARISLGNATAFNLMTLPQLFAKNSNMQLFPVAHKGMDMYTGNNLEQKYHNSPTTHFSLANRLASVFYITNFVTVHNDVQPVRQGETRGMGKLRADA